MRTLFDSSTVVAGLWAGHPKHLPAVQWLARAKRGEIQASVSAHGIAECYAVLTGLPVVPRLHPILVQKAIDEALTYVSLVGLTGNQYREALAQARDSGVVGSAFFDLLHILAARKAGCEVIATLNVRDFQRLAGGDPPRMFDAAT